MIIEAKLDKGRGPVATLLVQEGTLKAGDAFIAGSHYGRVRAMLNDKGQKIEDAPPSIPVEVVGFTDVPEAGETFIVSRRTDGQTDQPPPARKDARERTFKAEQSFAGRTL